MVPDGLPSRMSQDCSGRRVVQREVDRARVEYVLQKAVYFKEFVFHLLLTEVSESNISLPFVSPFVEPRDAVTWRGHND